jgi:hypothetical protein
MAAIANVVINDGQGTPVAHTFSPAAIKGDIATWFDRSGGIAVGYPMLSVSLRAPLAKGARVYKATVKILSPTLEVTSPSTGSGIQPAPTKGYDCTFIGDFLLPERSTKPNRADILAYAKNALAHATIKTLVEDLENVY